MKAGPYTPGRWEQGMGKRGCGKTALTKTLKYQKAAKDTQELRQLQICYLVRWVWPKTLSTMKHLSETPTPTPA